jgi:CheY-like chemotaxis protein
VGEVVQASPLVLVVDDDPSLRLLCRVNLELDGYRVVEAGSIDEARDLLAREEIDALLLDVHVGLDDGRTLLRELRERGTAPPAILLTGSVRLTEPDRALADAVLTKPFELDDLTQAVRGVAPMRGRDTAP